MKNSYEIQDNVVFMEINVKGKTMITAFDLVDLERVESIEGTWFGFVDNRSGKVYVALSKKDEDKKRKTILLHRFILGLENEKGFHVDHVNFNTLDNRRGNLKATSPTRNMKRQNNERSKVRKRGSQWFVVVLGHIVGLHETRKDALIHSVHVDRELFPELEDYVEFETVLKRLEESQ
ncbi:hypothetical protein QUF73_24850 [Cytobacillus sp. NJ13]|nr:hypothetical protein [Cytobacillus sp. NJ13]